jgi:uncharacterized protein YqhQ
VEKPKGEYLQFGGMAVVEGIMMRSPKFWAVACRAPNGEIVTRSEPLEKSWLFRQRWLQKPFLRGTLALLDTMALGLRAMNFASNVQLDQRFLKPEDLPKTNDKKTGKTLETAAIAGTLVVSLGLSYLIFDVTPEWTAQAAKNALGVGNVAANAIAEVIKVIFFIGYLLLIRRLPSILEVFRYHGAEHMAINALERRQDLTVENVMAQTRLHPRCGTNFAIMVIIVGFIVFIPIPRDLFVGPNAPDWAIVVVRNLVKLLVLPLVAGISYEVIRAAGKMRDEKWVNAILKPGLATQLITTEPAKEEHAEVAISALSAVLQAEESGEATDTHPDFLPGRSGGSR